MREMSVQDTVDAVGVDAIDSELPMDAEDSSAVVAVVGKPVKAEDRKYALVFELPLICPGQQLRETRR